MVIAVDATDTPARYRRVVAGGIVIVVVMVLVLPIAVMLGGAVWSALMGHVLSEDAALRHGEIPQE